MKSLADELPPEVAQHVHLDWRKNEAGYWAAREGLLADRRGQWVAFADGAVVASGSRAVLVMEEAQQAAPNAYIACVGHEDAPHVIRRGSFAYDAAYPGEPLPVLAVEFRPASGTPGTLLDRVIADTGADTTVLPWADCQRMGLDQAQGRPGRLRGVAGGTAATLTFFVRAYLDGQEYPCQLLADFGGSERILGRDVLNSLEALFRGPGREVVINP